MALGQTLRRGLRRLVLALAASGLIVGVKLLVWGPDPVTGIVILLGSATAFGTALYLKAVQEADPLLAWLAEHAHEVKAGTALYEGSAVRAEDEIVRFQACTSVIAVSFRYTSPWQLAGVHPVLGTGLLYSLVTLASG